MRHPTKYVFVQQYGIVWRLTKANYKRMLTYGAAGEEYDLDSLGTVVATDPETPLDWETADYQEALNRL